MSGTHYYNVGDGKTYSTIQLAIDAIPGDLSGTGQHLVCVYPKAAGYAETLDIATGFSNAGATDYIDVQAMVSHGGMRESGIIIDVSATADLIGHIFMCSYTRVHGFCITAPTDISTPTGSRGIFAENGYAAANNCRAYDNVIYDGIINTLSAYLSGFYNFISGGSDYNYFYNNLILNLHKVGQNYGGMGVYSYTGGNYVKAFNNTVLNCEYGIVGSANCDYWDVANNYCGRSDGGVFSNGYFNFGSNSHGYLNYNISSDGTADDFGGTGNLANKAAADQFKCVTAGEEDLRLKMTADCLRPGQDNSALFTDDIRGEERTYWATGAFEPETESDCVFSTAYRNKLMDFMFGNEAFSVPPTMWLGLSTTDPLSDGSGITEPTDVAYERREIPNDTDSWEDATISYYHYINAGIKANKIHVIFPQASSDWTAPIRYWFLATAEEAGDMIAYGVIDAPGRYVLDNERPIIRVGDLTILLQDPAEEPA